MSQWQMILNKAHTIVLFLSRLVLGGCESESRSIVSYSLQPHGLYSLWNSLGQNTGVCSLSLLGGIFPTEGLNLGLLHCRQILYKRNRQGGHHWSLSSVTCSATWEKALWGHGNKLDRNKPSSSSKYLNKCLLFASNYTQHSIGNPFIFIAIPVHNYWHPQYYIFLN